MDDDEGSDNMDASAANDKTDDGSSYTPSEHDDDDNDADDDGANQPPAVCHNFAPDDEDSLNTGVDNAPDDDGNGNNLGYLSKSQLNFWGL
jgi:hypothetical protein